MNEIAELIVGFVSLHVLFIFLGCLFFILGICAFIAHIFGKEWGKFSFGLFVIIIVLGVVFTDLHQDSKSSVNSIFNETKSKREHEIQIFVRELTNEERQLNCFNDGGLCIEDVEEISPAYSAGLRKGHIILFFNSDIVRDVSDFEYRYTSVKDNESVYITGMNNCKSWGVEYIPYTE